MRNLFLFMMISLDGYHEGVDHDLSWHNVDDEFVEFAIEQLASIDTILFGRHTYEMMASFWPSEEARKDDPKTAKLMSETSKVVFSHSLKEVAWQNSRLAQSDIADEVIALKKQSGKELAVFGSNNLCLSLIEYGLLDELRIMANPVVLGKGTPLFVGLQQPLPLTLAATRRFKNGNMLLTYQVSSTA